MKLPFNINHSLSQNVVFETINQEPREALEEPQNCAVQLCANWQGPPDGLPLYATLHESVGMQGRITFVSRADGQSILTDQPSDPNLIPRPLSCAEGDSVQMYGEPRYAGSRHCLTMGNRIYNDI